ncbi:MAG: M20/M25/M40 family metallo-hydrolase [Gemmatimonadota bacterium]|nr:M20/M25/M40 family metallo-hydrolase [Gemmatimonadota bacterium]
MIRGAGALVAVGLAFVAPALFVSCDGESSFGPDVDADVERAARSITAAELRAHVEAVAHDSMLGRGTPGPGLDAAGRYVRERFEEAGLSPAIDGAWEQTFEVFFPSQGTALNVVGVIEGSDPAARDEYVIVSAHMDHLGLASRPIDGDSIFNGADDNGSGTSALLELAEALGELDHRPRRSIVFAAFGAEEQGLIGSSWYVSQPPFPIETTVAVLNMDMLSRNSPDTIAILRSSAAIGSVADAVATRSPGLGLTVGADPWPSENLIRRSDQWSFIRSGVEGLLMTSGLHADYHGRHDEADRIDPDKLERVARLALLILLDLADPAVWSPP